MQSEFSRRPLKTRAKNWPRQLAFRLVRFGLTPNQISAASLVISAIGATCFFAGAERAPTARTLLFLSAAVCIQLRLLCNLLDGLMAVEGGLKTKTGEIFNEFPDRIADVLLLVAAGYSVRWHCENAIELGFLCAIAAVLTAYVRGFGGSAGLPQDFCGPMAKQQRMATLTFACILSAAEASLRFEHRFMLLALAIIFGGSLFTAGRRTKRIVQLLNAR
ncbi:MAG: CDP-alcohol phosphatidyltransferase family protein [Verrucomicrobiota bacterium]|nr:CDP-alcohol phosphatidyltransferase family protein [Chthoniobacterales bacterium]MBA3762984.1 CDP-alcohol phosphatidyltransferase family protein [Chthoniobacterales bacterium]MDQ3314992.1 CDP-alcohol phosphatidyltransferase family protein [Verrucomicrobiota bacterium]